ncbi:bpX6 domain-containing protein [Gilliamella sp. Pas-s25]|uniref:bpX6 domain-containing protein n=1 Tax=Gilliamella sp. Pas-s25 TaxID=2687310 RepID=UPI00135D1725|nr:bpX6 domain-containing protein [Gilliamella sp. Pas-s25]MWP62957.1 hypothetical protein [Gilliamella sp. Pas-s25]
MENTTDFIRYPTLKGAQSVSGIWFPTQWFNSKQRRRLLIQYYFLGCEIYQFEKGDLLTFPSERMLYCERLEGWPLIYQNGLLCSTKLPKTNSQQLPQADLLLIIGNHISTYYFNDAVNVDPSLWVDLDGYQLLETKSYTINDTYDVLPDLIIESKSMTQIFDDKIPSPSPKLIEFIEQKKQNKKNVEQQISKQNIKFKPCSQRRESRIWLLCIAIFSILFLFSSIVTQNENLFFELEDNAYALKIVLVFIAFLVFIFIKFKSIIELLKLIKGIKQSVISDKIVVKSSAYFAKKLDDNPQNNKANYAQIANNTHSMTYRVNSLVRSQSTVNGGKLDEMMSIKDGIANIVPIVNPSNDIPERRKNHNRKPSRWRKYLSLFSIVSKLSHLIAFQQGNYIETMMKKFEQGNLEDALRYAIPLGADSDSKGQAFGVPKPRNKLSLSESVYGNSSSINLDEKLYQHLQSLYRQSFEKLAKENKVEQAVFVLVELLNNLQEGLEFLEERKLYKQAMELAIARDADPEYIVKLCCLANDWHKAIMIARRDNIFANAILILEKTNQQLANKLRLEWTNTLAEKAEWLAAIDTIWPLTQYRHLAEKWFNYVDPLNPKAIVKRFILKPDDALDKLEDSLSIIKNTPSYYQKRLDIAQEIIAQQHVENLKSLLCVLINHIVLDAVTYPNTLTKFDIARLIAFTQDQSIRVDIPISSLASLKLVRPCPLFECTTLQHISCPEVGHRAIYSMVVLTDDRYLLALGQAGMIIVDRTGKQLTHFMIAADKLIISDNKMQVLALAKCGDYYRIHKIDLSTKKTLDLGIIKFQHCHEEFDGINWTIINNNYIEVIDISSKLSVVWRVDLSPNQIEQIARNESDELYLTLTPNNEFEEFHYSRSNRYLTHRGNIDIEPGVNKIAISKKQGVLFFKYDKASQRILFKPRNYRFYQYKEIPLNLSQEQFDTMGILSIDCLAILQVKRLNELGSDIYFYHYLSNSFKMVIDWHSSDPFSIFCSMNECCLFDKQGRGLHINVNENKVTLLSI